MVLSLGPGKFYGTSLPRPWVYNDVKFNAHRVDPPLSVTDPLMSWAEEAHWSMGGLSFTRLRLQGKIEGNVEKLRSQREKQFKPQTHSPLPHARSDASGSKRASPASPPPAPLVTKRRRFINLLEEVAEEKEKEEEQVRVSSRRGSVKKKLGDDFDRVASENEGSDSVAVKTGRRRLVKIGDASKKVLEEVTEKWSPKGNKKKDEGEKTPVRTSPRLAKRVAN